MQKLIGWCKKNWDELSVLFLLSFIPLYPKLPIVDVVQTWVYIRLDDFIVALFIIGFLSKLYKQKRIPDTPLTVPILVYWVAGAISVAYSLAFIGPKLLGYFPQLVFLHYFRRIEYMIVYFLAAVSIRTEKQIGRFLLIFALTVFAVSLYGLGQRFLSFPAYLTMNEEFAKGTPLILSPTSRISSTFAGHYDFAMYLAFAMTIFTGLLFALKNVFLQAAIVLILGLGTMNLLLTQSRVSLLVFGLGLLCIFWWNKKKWLIVPLILAGIGAVTFVPGVSDRFAKTFRLRPVVYDSRAGIPIGAAIIKNDGQVTIEKSASPALENLPIGSGFIRIPTEPQVPLVASFALGELRNAPDYPFGRSHSSLGEELQMAMEREQMYLSLTRPLSTSSGEVASVSGRFLLDHALLYDISFTTRFQGEWPRAWEAFERNLILGSGYSVLSLSTDSDYLRALGETGIVGFASFFFIPLVFFIFTKQAIGRAPPLNKAFAMGSVVGTLGLLITASLVDVFEASKIAYVFWLTLGASVGGLIAVYPKKFSLATVARRIISHPLVFIVIIFLIVPIVYKGITGMYFLADDFTWLRWASQSSLSDIPTYFTDATGFFYRPLTKTYFLLASLVFWFKPSGYHWVNVFLHIGATVLTYFIVARMTKNYLVPLLSAFYFLVGAIHHENVIWISGISSLMGSFFVLLSLYVWMRIAARGWRQKAFLLCAVIILVLAMLSYEGMMFAPLILVGYAFIFWPKRRAVWSLSLVLLIPLYWWVRTSVHALSPSGSYGVNMLLLPFNLVGNLFGYVLMVLLGPYAISWYAHIRELMRANILISAVIILFGTIGFIVIIKAFRQKIKLGGAHKFFLAFVFVSLLPYLGLGNIAERYGYLASVGISFLFVEFVFWVWRSFQAHRWWAAVMAAYIFGISLSLNYNSLKAAIEEWGVAGKLSEHITADMRKKYYPLMPGTKFVVANVPTRIGRAWVFPVGLSDAAYQVFYEKSMTLSVVGNSQDALSVRRADPTRTKALIVVGDLVKELYE